MLVPATNECANSAQGSNHLGRSAWKQSAADASAMDPASKINVVLELFQKLLSFWACPSTRFASESVAPKD